MTELSLLRYYRALDAGDLDAALALMAPDISFVMAIPGALHRGCDRAGIGAYLTGRGDVVRRHAPLRWSRDRDLEFVYGAVVEDESRVTGHYLAAARTNPDGTLASYHVSFDPEIVLLAEEVALP